MRNSVITRRVLFLLRCVLKRVIDGVGAGLVVGLISGAYVAVNAHPLIASYIRGGREGAVLWGVIGGVVFGAIGGAIGRAIGGAILTAIVVAVAVVDLLIVSSPPGS